jgi:hypothetical protein
MGRRFKGWSGRRGARKILPDVRIGSSGVYQLRSNPSFGSQKPKSGTVLPGGGKVNLVVSRDRKPS